MGAELEIELVEDRSALQLAATDWNALVARNETNTVFQTYEWFDAWWQSLRGRNRLFFLYVRHRGAIVGFAPLMLGRTSLGLRQLEFVGTGNADYQDFVLPVDKPAALKAIAAFLHANSRRWDRLRLTNVPSHSSTLVLLTEAAKSTGLAFVEEAIVPCPVLMLTGAADAARDLIARYSLRRPLNWFKSRGELRCRYVTELAEIESLLPIFFDQHVERWRFVGKSSQFERVDQRQFYIALARTLHSTGWLAFFTVEFDRKPIAFHFGFDYDECIVWYKPSFDSGLAARSPGLLLIRQLIEDAVHRDKKEFDFTIGDEAFKARFANRRRANHYVSLYASNTLGSVAAGIKWLRQAGGRMRRRFATNRALRLAHAQE